MYFPPTFPSLCDLKLIFVIGHDMFVLFDCTPVRLWDAQAQQLAWTMNLISVHSMFLDCFDEVLIHCGDFSFMW